MNAPADRVQYVQARLLLRRGRWAEAAALLDQPAHGRRCGRRTLYRQTNLLLAHCYEQLGDAAGELDAYRRLLENDPNAGSVRLDFAKALARAGQADEAVSQFLSVVPRAEVSSRAVAETARTCTTSSGPTPRRGHGWKRPSTHSRSRTGQSESGARPGLTWTSPAIGRPTA